MKLATIEKKMLAARCTDRELENVKKLAAKLNRALAPMRKEFKKLDDLLDECYLNRSDSEKAIDKMTDKLETRYLRVERVFTNVVNLIDRT